MAKKKPKKTGKKVGASKGSTSKQFATMLAGVGVGAVGTYLADARLLPTTSYGIKGGAEVGIGGYAALKVKNPMIKGVGIGMAAFGLIRLFMGLTGKTITGIGCAPNQVGGFRDVAAIGAAANPIKRFPQPAGVGNARTRAAAVAAMS